MYYILLTQLDAVSDALAILLQEQGLGKGDTAIISGPNSLHFLITEYALIKVSIKCLILFRLSDICILSMKR